MIFRQIQPAAHLKDHVRYFWTLESDVQHLDPAPLGPLADGCPGFVFQPENYGTYCDENGKQLPQVFMYGQTIKRTRLLLTGRFHTLGACFYPHTLRTVFGLNAGTLTDACIDLDLLFAHLCDQLTTAASAGERIQIISSYLYACAAQNDHRPDAAVQQALSQIITSKGNVPLRELQQSLKLSERSFERRFNEHVGISPKLFARVCKFQATLSQLRNNGFTRLSDIAYDNGYADQSHFIRSFREFTGSTPLRFRQQPQSAADHLLY
jgi:AraC-like DNA-binding protein